MHRKSRLSVVILAGVMFTVAGCSLLSSTSTSSSEDPEIASSRPALAIFTPVVPATGGRLEYQVVNADVDDFWGRDARLERSSGSGWDLVLNLQTSASGGAGSFSLPDDPYFNQQGGLIADPSGTGPVQSVDLSDLGVGTYRVTFSVRGSETVVTGEVRVA